MIFKRLQIHRFNKNTKDENTNQRVKYNPVIISNKSNERYPEYLLGKRRYNSVTDDIEPFIILQGISQSVELSRYLQEICMSIYPEPCYIQIHTKEKPDSDLWIPISCESVSSIEYLNENASLQDVIARVNNIITYLRGFERRI